MNVAWLTNFFNYDSFKASLELGSVKQYCGVYMGKNLMLLMVKLKAKTFVRQ